MRHLHLSWSEPRLVSTLVRTSIPDRAGLYVFLESGALLAPNPQIPAESDPRYDQMIRMLRRQPRVLYVGRSNNHQRRLPGYRYRPYLEIRRRPAGTAPKHVADRHRGRAQLHAQQYFAAEGIERPLVVRWKTVDHPRDLEMALIRELRPLMNTIGLPRR